MGRAVDKLIGMKVFTRVAKAGSFAGGARDMAISRAMATKHIMQLEKHLDTRLFNRTTRSLSLTEVGASYLGRCQQVLMDIEEMEAAATQLQTEPRGMLRISAPPVLGATQIAPALAEFLKIHPDLNVEMTLQGSPGDIIDDGIDIAFHLGELKDTSLIGRKLASSPLVVCGSPTYFKNNGTPMQPEDLQQHSCLVNWAITPRDQWQFRGAAGDIVIKVSGRIQSNVADPIRIAAINDLGMIMLPRYIVGRDIQKGKLQVVLNNYVAAPLGIHAVYPHRKYLSAKVRTFLDFFQHSLRQRVGLLEAT
jgi:DNA-binding transcriptional LysR family regulator